MADETLVLLANEIRSRTIRMCEGVSEEQALWKPAGTNNHFLWHVGHAFCLGEGLGLAAIAGREPRYPEGWFEKFSWKSNPAAVTSWPKLSEIVAALQGQLTGLTAAIQNVTPEQWGRTNERGRTLRYTVLHGLHDEAIHQGEMHLLKKLYARR